MQLMIKHLLLIAIFIGSVSSSFAQDYNLEAAKTHLQNNQKKFNLSGTDLKEMTVSSAYLSPTTGWYHVYFNQTYQAVEVYNGILNVTLKDGHIIHIANSFIPDLAIQLAETTAARNIDAKGAYINALKSLNLKTTALEQIEQISAVTNAQGEAVKYLFRDKNTSDEPVEVKLFWFQHQTKIEGKLVPKISLTWSVNFLTKDKQNAWNVQVDVGTGNILSTLDNVIKCNFGHSHRSDQNLGKCQELAKQKDSPSAKKALAANSYNVFDYPLESPNHGNRSIVTDPYNRFVPAGTGPGSTNGWHNDGTSNYTDTRGNNVFAQDDTNADNSGGVRPNPSNYDFDYSYTLGLNTAAANQNASITNLFYWNNFIHDVLWKMGFNEAAGNFQTNNMTRGGLGNDVVYADAQDGSGTNNANFFTPVDGNSPRMQMFLWNIPSTYLADSDFDNAIIAHEYGHGWSIRLTGGPNNSSCLQNVEQGGEGWSDYLGLMLTTNWALLQPNITSANIPRGIGTYVLGQGTSGLGIRPYPYSYNMAGVNPLVTYAAVGNTSFSEPHGIGSIWATMLWDMTWEIIFQDNAIEANIFNTDNMIGNVVALKLVNEGLRLQPCSPSFVQARDAILAADQALFAGRYRCAIGRAFARRGLGLNASTGTSSNDRTVITDYTVISGNSLSSASSATICSGIPFQYNATSNTAGTVFSWSRASVSGISNPQTSSSTGVINESLINTTNTPVVVTYVFSFSPNGCGQSGNVQQTIQVIVNPTPPAPNVASYSICQNGTVPSGQGLVMPNANIVNPINDALVVGPTFARPGYNSSEFYYKSYSFVAPITGFVTFEITSGSFDTYLFLYDLSFNSASPSTNLLASDDDSGSGTFSLISRSLVQGRTYYVVVSSFNSLVTGNYTLNTTSGGFGTGFNWYTTATGGNSIFSGSVFNPVGVVGSGIVNTFTPIVKNYYVARNDNPACRATTTFTINQATADPNLSGIMNGNETICAIFNSGTLSLSGHTGTILGWETSENKFKTWTTTPSISTNYPYSGLVASRQVRAILDRGNCSIARSGSASLNVISPMQNLVDSVKIDTVFNKVSLSIVSVQKITPNSKVDYVAGRKIELNSGFESAGGSSFKAEIVDNNCFIPVALTLQPDSTQSKDTDISSLFANTSFERNKYMVPYSWSQFGTPETRRSLLQFDLSSLPTNAIVDSAFLSLSFSQKFVQDSPPFTGHFGSNSLEIRRITQDWTASTATWTNQPTTTNNNVVNVSAATSQSQDYPKINVKNLVIDQFTNTNFGFMIKHQIEAPYKITCLTSSEEIIASKRPKLVVYYRYK